MNILQDISLLPFNTFKIDVRAKYFFPFTSLDDLQEVLTHFHKGSFDTATPLILGGGSNILFTKNIDHLVLKNDLRGIEIIKEDKEFVYVRSAAGESWHAFVEYCIAHQFGGVENLSLIPGSVGAGPMQNIGAYGVEIKDVFHELEAYHLQDKHCQTFNRDDCEFGYRESVFKNKFKNQYAITSVTFRLRKQPEFNISYGAISQELEAMGVQDLSLRAVSQAVINIRRSKLPDPAVIGNAGSFFKNPEVDNEVFQDLQLRFPGIVGYPVSASHTKLAAGWMIEQCGWKGYRKADAGCHEKQALVLVNYGSASGAEILALSEAIIASVKEKFDVVLQREVNIM